MKTGTPAIDVLLLLEGTFPYVSGGVSSWVNQMIRGFPEFTFGIVFIGSRREDYGEIKYALPENVAYFESFYLYEAPAAAPVLKCPMSAEMLGSVKAAHTYFQQEDSGPSDDSAYRKMLEYLTQRQLSREMFLHSEEAWGHLCEEYRSRSTDPSFVDYFWTIRAMHSPIWLLNDIAAKAPPARLYHTVSTGYAGFLGVLLKHRTGAPLLLSEHGIYTKERKIDLYQSGWIKDNRNVFQRESTQISYFRQLWIRFFEMLGQSCYHASNRIVALYEANRLRQVRDGAPAARTCNIPNGIDLPRFAALRALRPDAPPPVLCLIGRVVPIKDIKTYIRAMRTVVNQMPDVEAWIAGPEDEAPEYAEECRNLVASLGLTEQVKFLGFQQVDKLLPKIGLMVLSSISEALPLVLLEGFAAGVPAVSTDVSSCPQLIYGLDEEDRALGAAGRVVGLADPQALAAAALELLGDETQWHAAQAAGIARVQRYYTHGHMFDAYRTLYRQVMDGAPPQDVC